MAKLAAYRAKRDFAKTSEPDGGEAGAGGETSGTGTDDLAFVIQKHDASRLHYDLRLELDGVMKSWAVAKGPSLVAGEKRLAVHVEDHPVAYNTFEGTIPKGQYGGGTVMVWDRGRWQPEEDPHRGYEKGHLRFALAGEKLGGSFHLVRMRGKPREKQEAWLLIKSEDAFARPAEAPDVLEEQPRSVVTGRTLDAIAADPDGSVWQSNRGEPGKPDPTPPHPEAAAKRPSTGAPPSRVRRGSAKGRAPQQEERETAERSAKGRATQQEKRETAEHSAKMPTEIEPCLASLSASVPRGGGWIHEIKWDGYRLIAFKKGKAVRLATRRGHDWTTRFPRIAAGVAALPTESVILDGEAVIEDDKGVSSFSALQNALSDEHGRIARDAVFFAFDILYADGQDLRALPLTERKTRLAALVPVGRDGDVRLSEHIDGEGDAMARSACQFGLEGIISKRRDRPYRSGRGEDWLKTKCTERQEFVVAGYVPSAVSRKAIGSLVLGYNHDGRLVHAGRTGTGFTAESSREIWHKLDPARRATSPFPAKLTAEERRGVVWVEPQHVAEVEFRGWTADERLRHASFKGLRDDKTVAEVVRERPLPVGDTERAAKPPESAAKPAAAKRSSGGAAREDEVAGVRLTHPERVLWDEGITKKGLAEFYETIAEWALPHLAGRPLSLLRCPSGSGHGCFFQKHSWAGLSSHIHREMMRDEGGEEEILYIEDLPGLVSLVQSGVLEIHPWGSTVADIERPDRITMDLDPAEDVAWPDVIAAARDLRERLRAVALESFVKTTGGKGLHVVIPLTPKASWSDAKSFAHALALSMEADAPQRYLAKASKQARRGRIYVDYLRNGRGATAVAAYSTRARPGAPISVPVSWSELSPSLTPNGFTLATLPKRLASLTHDPWADLVETQQVLPIGRNTVGAKRKLPKTA